MLTDKNFNLFFRTQLITYLKDLKNELEKQGLIPTLEEAIAIEEQILEKFKQKQNGTN